MREPAIHHANDFPHYTVTDPAKRMHEPEIIDNNMIRGGST